jgi:Zn-dependent M16 (insulinase) family peptidase
MSIKSARSFAVGQTHHDFLVTKATEIHELQCILLELVHLPTGAQVMHIANDDPENLFCLSFQTLPDSSNGVAHILEHTVLCGSKKFPVKDPFFAMTRRSLNTFMNALTGSDFTCYPAASQVSKDFYNLLDVYLDAVFYPNLNELSFLQEGHRFEFSDPKDYNSTLEYKGIVFNEMKGALASPSARINEMMNEALFPDLTYGFNSGGDPKNIPDLTYEELIVFHQTYYHPSRCLFFFYGNMPLETHLDFIAKHALDKVKKVSPIPPIPTQKRMTEPKRLIKYYPLSEDEDTYDKTLISFGWLTCHILDQREVLALSIIEIILMDTDASPLKLALLRSGLCKQASVYMDVDISEVPVQITLKGCNPENADSLETLIRETLQKIVKEGISLELVENAMHQLEFFRSEITGNHAPFGLSLFMRSALLKHHEGKPEDGLMIHSLFDQLRQTNLSNPKYLTGLIQKYFIDNPHFVRITLIPDKTLGAKEVQEEKEILQKIQTEMTLGEKKQIVEKALELTEFQKRQEDEDFDVLPTITLEDVPKAVRPYPLTQEKIGNLEVFHHSCFTNEIVYADLFFNLPSIDEEDLSLMRFLTILIAQMGCGDKKYVEVLDYIQAHTGGIAAYLTMFQDSNDLNKYQPVFALKGKALHRKTSKLFPLMHEMILKLDFTDHERIKEVLLKHYTSLNSSLQQSALKYAMNLSASGLDIQSKIANDWYGLDYYWKIKSIADDIDVQTPLLAKKLEKLHKRLVGLENPHLVLSCSATMYDELKGKGFYGLKDIDTTTAVNWRADFKLPIITDQGRVIASQIAFTSKVMKTIPYVHPDSAALSLASGLFENVTLHSIVREQGGAYGGGCSNNATSGLFCFYSYRDPNISKTLDAFDEAVEIVLKGEFSESDLEEAKLEIIQGQDAPVAPGSRADVSYAWMREGRTTEMRQAFRDRLLSLTKEDVIKAVRKHIKANLDKSVTVVFAGKDLLEKENAILIDSGKKPLKIESI